MAADRERLGRLCEDLAPELLGYLARRVDPVADAADLLSETLLVLCRRPGALPAGDEEARLWAFGVARRVLAGHRRTIRRRTALVDRVRSELVRPGPHGADDGTVERVGQALRTLAPLDREIIRLVHWEGLTQVEVARVLGRPAATVRSRYARARSRLRPLLQEGTGPTADPTAARPGNK